MNPNNEVWVGVLGAGAGGIAVALELAKQGFKVRFLKKGKRLCWVRAIVPQEEQD